MKRYPRIRSAALVIGIALLVACPFPGQAQGTVQFQHLTVKQGLSQSAATCIFQDRQGFIWIGTQDGLNRYDGYSCLVFKHDPADSTSLSENFVVSISEDSTGELYVGTLNDPATLNRFDRTSETFRRVPREQVQIPAGRGSAVFSTYTDAQGVRWTGSIGGGVTRFDPSSGRTKTYRHDAADSRSLIDDKVYSVYGDRRGTIWIGTRGGLDRYDPRTDGFIHYRHDDGDPRSLSHNWVWPMLEDSKGVMWVGTFGGGLNRFDREKGTFTAYRQDETNPRGISDDRLYSLTEDRSGMIWVGTADHGVDRFHPQLTPFAHYAHSPKDPSSLANNNVSALCADRNGNLWVGTTDGLDLFDRTRTLVQRFRNIPGNARSLGSNSVATIYEDRQGVIWVGFVSGGLDRYNKATGTFTHYTNDPNNPASLSDNRVYALLNDRQGDLWIGTYGGALNRLNPRTGTFTHFRQQPADTTALGGRGVWALCEDREGVIWVGTYGGGLNRFDRATGTFRRFTHRDGDDRSLSDDIVLSILEDRSGALWVGTTGGLNRFDRTTGAFTAYRQKDGLPNEMILGILEDGKGGLWLSTNKGLSRFNPQQEQFRNYDANSGLQGDEFMQNAYAIDRTTGEMFFGGANGFNVFHPDSVRSNPYVPPIVFSGFTRYNTDEKEGEPIAERGVAVKEEIRLSYKDNVAVFEFAALNYFNAFKNQYAYHLEGYSDGWIQLGPERKATFTNLDAGSYILRVKGSNDDGIWNEQGTALDIIVTPPWWKTRWAYAAYGLLAFGFLSGVRRFELERREQKSRVRESELRTKAAEAEKRALEAENERKTKELEDARQLQLSMLPKDVPRLPEYDIAVSIRTATEVGGDYYDFHAAADGTLDVALGDATGHGMQAGTIVTLMKGLFLSESSRMDIAAFFSHSSRAIKEIKLGRLFMAFTLVRLKGNSVSFACAGMPPVFIYRNATGTIEEVLLKGMPLGAMKAFAYAVHATELRAGDALLLLTDGLPEQKDRHGAMFEYGRVQAAFAAQARQPASTIVSAMLQEGERWMEGAMQEDDITVLVIRRTS